MELCCHAKPMTGLSSRAPGHEDGSDFSLGELSVKRVFSLQTTGINKFFACVCFDQFFHTVLKYT